MFSVQRCLPLVAAALILTAATEWQPLFDGKSLQGWTETPFTGHAAVKIENAQILLPYGKPMTGITLTRDSLDRTTRSDSKRHGCRATTFFASLTFPVGDSFATWVTGGWGGDIVGISSIDGWDASDNETRSYFNFENGRWYALRASSDGRSHPGVDRRPADRQCRDHGAVHRPSTRAISSCRRRSGSRPMRLTGALRKIEYRLLKVAVECPVRPVRALQIIVRFGANWLRGRSRRSYSSLLPARCATRPEQHLLHHRSRSNRSRNASCCSCRARRCCSCPLQASIHSRWNTSPPAGRPLFSASQDRLDAGIRKPRAAGTLPSRNWITGNPFGPGSALGMAVMPAGSARGGLRRAGRCAARPAPPA